MNQCHFVEESPRHWRCQRCGWVYPLEADRPPRRNCPVPDDLPRPDDWTPDQPSRGLGDTVAKLTHRLRIKQCGGCRRRQRILNKRFPYGRRRRKRPRRSPPEGRLG